MKLNMSGNVTSGESIGSMQVISTNGTVYRTPSSSRQGLFHFTVLDTETGNYPICTCEGYQYRGKCKHSDAAHEKYWNDFNSNCRKIEPSLEEFNTEPDNDVPVESCPEGNPDD